MDISVDIMTDIPAKTIARFHCRKRELLRAERAGEYQQVGKEGATIRVVYPAGAMIVADTCGRVIAGPLAPLDAMELAWQILDGDARAMTAPDSLLSLAAAVFGFGLIDPPAPAEPENAASEASVA